MTDGLKCLHAMWGQPPSAVQAAQVYRAAALSRRFEEVCSSSEVPRLGLQLCVFVFKRKSLWRWPRAVVGKLFDHVAGLMVEAHAPRIFHGNVESFENEVGPPQVN